MLFGGLIGLINFSLLYLAVKKFKLQKNNPLYFILYILKFIFIGILIILFLKFKWGNIFGLITGFTISLIIFYIGVMINVRSSGSN